MTLPAVNDAVQEAPQRPDISCTGYPLRPWATEQIQASLKVAPPGNDLRCHVGRGADLWLQNQHNIWVTAGE